MLPMRRNITQLLALSLLREGIVFFAVFASIIMLGFFFYEMAWCMWNAKNRHYLLRDVYDDMMLDGVKPERDTFHSLIVGTMKGARLQDAFFFRDEMKCMGLVPDVWIFLIFYWCFVDNAVQLYSLGRELWQTNPIWCVLMMVCWLVLSPSRLFSIS